MCNIGTAISAIGLGLQGAGMISNYIANNQQEAAYTNYQALQTQSTLTNYLQQTKAINTRYAQEQEASGIEQQQLYLQNLKAKATAQASAASSGVDGASLDALFRGYDRATAMSNYVSARNLHMKGLQYNEELEGLRIQAISSINSQQQYYGTGASTLLGGLGSMLSNYANVDLRKSQYKYYNK